MQQLQLMQLYIEQFVSKTGKFNHNAARFKFSNDQIVNLFILTDFLPTDTEFSKRCITILNGLTELPKCLICRAPHNIYGGGKYNLTCGNSVCKITLRTHKAAETMKANGTYVTNGTAHRIRMSDPILKQKHSVNISKALNTPNKDGILPKCQASASLHKTHLNNPQISKTIQKKRRNTLEKKGIILPLDLMPASLAYRAQVHKVTMQQPLHLLENFNLRGPSTANPHDNNFHIDHIFSVADGFKNEISPEIIGNICNLRMLHHTANVKKSAKSEITMAELFHRYLRNSSI